MPENPKLEVEVLLETKTLALCEGPIGGNQIDAFPYTKYGLIDGEVSNISRDSIEDEKQGLVYPARIRLLQTTVNVRGKAVS